MDKQKKAEINNCLIGVRNRDRESLEKLYMLVAHSLKYIAFKYMQNEQDALDLEQDFWARIFEIADGFNYLKNGFSYLSRVMTNMAINRYKEIFGDRQHTAGEVYYNTSSCFDEDFLTDRLDDNIAIEKAMVTLKPIERRVIQLRVFEQMTLMQIAGEIGKSKSQVSRIELAALEKLRNEITNYRMGKF